MGAAPRGLSEADIRAFLTRLGERYRQPATLYLLGGSALLLLGNPRPTVDVDYFGSDLPHAQEEWQRVIQQVADEMQIDVEAVPLQDFIPLPRESARRHVRVGQFGALNVYVFDPYSIALSKIERGFESDLEDIVFLFRSNLITIKQLEQTVQESLQRAQEFGLDASQMHARLDAVRQMI